MENKKFYMNVHTGSVDELENWEADTRYTTVRECIEAGTLVEVVQYKGDWYELETRPDGRRQIDLGTCYADPDTGEEYAYGER
jgi:hypothetical protein